MRARTSVALIGGATALVIAAGIAALIPPDEQSPAPRQSPRAETPGVGTAVRDRPASEHEMELLLLMQERKKQTDEVLAVSARIQAQLDELRNGG